MLDWDDLRFVLSVARTGSTLGAARELGVNQTTVARRIANAESAVGASLFERRQDGYRLTDLGREAAARAAAIQAQVFDLESEITARKRAVTGTVRFTCPETIANHLLAPWLGAFQQRHPEALIEVNNSDAMLDLGKGEADVAMRIGAPPSGPGIVARRLPDCPWTAYTSRGYAREHGSPREPTALRGHALVVLDGAQARLPSAVWFGNLVGVEQIKVRCNSLSSVVHSLRAGLGVGMLPCVIGDTDDELKRCFAPPPELNAQAWLIVREEARSTPLVRAFVEYLASRYARQVRRRSAEL